MAWAPGWFVKSRVYLCTAVSCFALGRACATAPAATSDLPGLARLLSAGAAAEVALDSVAWEASGGLLADLFWGRQVLFLAKPNGRLFNDLFRARVRVSREGHVIAVRSVSNLTETDLGHETALQLRGDYAAFATVAFGELQGLTALDLSGFADSARHGSWFNRQLLQVRAWQRTGTLGGIGRSHIGVANAERVRLRLEPPLLQIFSGEEQYTVDLEREAFIDSRLGEKELSRHSHDDRAVLTPQHQGSDQWLHTWVDVVREELGPRSVAWLEDALFVASDEIRRRSYDWFVAPRPMSDSAAAAVGQREAERRQATASWPPPDIRSIWREPVSSSENGEPQKVEEGRWVDFRRATQTSEPQAGPVFKRTFIHPDPKRPYSRLELVAMDMRRLELRMQAGFEEPRPKTGPPGAGALPDDAATLKRVAATFNGAFKSLHGDYGMMVDRRVLVPPKPGAASIVLRKDSRVGLGDWGSDARIDEEVVSFRQNLDALVADGRLNPRARSEWGEPVVGHSSLTERSALCLSRQGNLYYAAGSDLTASSLARGMIQADCVYAVHLDMNPGHTGFFFVGAEAGTKSALVSTPALSTTSVHPKKFALWSDKDFFYLLRRSAAPKLGELTWRPSLGSQPEPAGTPGLFESSMKLGALTVRLFIAEGGRVRYQLTGGGEPLIEGRPSPRRQLAKDESAPTLFALSLGHTTLPTRYGLAFGDRATLPLRRVYATLVIDEEAGLTLVPSGRRVEATPGRDYVQLPELVKDGRLTARASQRGAKRPRGALCVLEGGRLAVALAEHDSSDALGLALVRLGCKHVLELDRASKHPATLVRAGTRNPAAADYETTTLHAVGQPMRPWTFRFNP